MALHRLDLSDFRNLLSLKLLPLIKGFNLIYGLNGSGKTSIIEAIYYLSLGRSFRSHLNGRIIHHAADKFTLFAEVQTCGEQIIPIGIERRILGDMKIRIAGSDALSIAELADLVPVQLIHSHSYNLLEGGPIFRRKYLDWGCFYLNPAFLTAWKDYGLVLKQRNAALRLKVPKSELVIWTQELIQKGLNLDKLRREYVEQLLPILINSLGDLLSLPGLKITYQSGWDKNQTYADVLNEAYAKDSHLGYTQFGPHRGDLRITINKLAAKDILSRGQQKLFVCAMILAQGTLLKASVNKRSIYLIDDLPAELDIVSRMKLIGLLAKQEAQVFITAVEREALGDALKTLPLKMFHVEHGCVTETN